MGGAIRYLILVLLVLSGACSPHAQPMACEVEEAALPPAEDQPEAGELNDESLIERLVRDAKKESCTSTSEWVSKPLQKDDVTTAIKRVKSYPDYTSYLVLMALRTNAPEAYKRMPTADKAAILVSALEKYKCLDDWGYLREEYAQENDAATALVETGKEAVPKLLLLLANKNDVMFQHGKSNVLSRAYGYRRCDFAYRYLCLILKRDWKFEKKPADRDKDIAQLKADLAKKP